MVKVHYKCMEQYFIQLIDNKKMEKYTEKKVGKKWGRKKKERGNSNSSQFHLGHHCLDSLSWPTWRPNSKWSNSLKPWTFSLQFSDINCVWVLFVLICFLVSFCPISPVSKWSLPNKPTFSLAHKLLLSILHQPAEGSLCLCGYHKFSWKFRNTIQLTLTRIHD